MSNVDWYKRKLAAVVELTDSIPPPPRIPHPSTVNSSNNVPVERTQPTQPAASGCPNCRSVNYGSPGGGRPPRCFECGYGLPIQNSTQGMTATGGGPVTPAVQVPTAGYQPTTIVGRID